MVGRGVEGGGAGGFAKAIVEIRRVGQHHILIAGADQAAAGRALDAHAGVVVGDGDVGGEVIDAGIDEDGVAEFPVVGFENGADGGLGSRGGQAVVGIIAGGGGVFVADGSIVVDVVVGDRRDDAED